MHYQRISQIKFYTSLTPSPLVHVTTAQSRQNARLLLQSSELGSPTTHSQASESPSFGSGGGTHSLGGEGVGVPILTRVQTLWYSRYIQGASAIDARFLIQI